MRLTNKNCAWFILLSLSAFFTSVLAGGGTHSGVGTLLAAGLITMLLKNKRHGNYLKGYQHNHISKGHILHGANLFGFGYNNIPHIITIGNELPLSYHQGIDLNVFRHNPYLLYDILLKDNGLYSDYFTNNYELITGLFPYGESLSIGHDVIIPNHGLSLV